jgi:hypothetical protein
MATKQSHGRVDKKAMRLLRFARNDKKTTLLLPQEFVMKIRKTHHKE